MIGLYEFEVVSYKNTEALLRELQIPKSLIRKDPTTCVNSEITEPRQHDLSYPAVLLVKFLLCYRPVHSYHRILKLKAIFETLVNLQF